MKKHWRVMITLAVLTAPFALGLLITYEVIPYDWISMMENQRSFRAMEEPLPLPENSVPVQGEVYISGTGDLDNPIDADEDSIQRGKELYDIHCALCHGSDGKGEGTIAAYLNDKKPADLTEDNLVNNNEGAIFMTITDGVGDTMPALRGNLSVEGRWHIVNYIQSLQE